MLQQTYIKMKQVELFFLSHPSSQSAKSHFNNFSFLLFSLQFADIYLDPLLSENVVSLLPSFAHVHILLPLWFHICCLQHPGALRTTSDALLSQCLRDTCLCSRPHLCDSSAILLYGVSSSGVNDCDDCCCSWSSTTLPPSPTSCSGAGAGVYISSCSLSSTCLCPLRHRHRHRHSCWNSASSRQFGHPSSSSSKF